MLLPLHVPFNHDIPSLHSGKTFRKQATYGLKRYPYCTAFAPVHIASQQGQSFTWLLPLSNIPAQRPFLVLFLIIHPCLPKAPLGSNSFASPCFSSLLLIRSLIFWRVGLSLSTTGNLCPSPQTVFNILQNVYFQLVYTLLFLQSSISRISPKFYS